MDWSATYSLSDDDSAQMVACLRTAIRTSEAAVLEIGGLLERIVAAAADTSDATEERDGAFAARTKGMMGVTAGFIAETRRFLARQADFARTANDAFRRIYACSEAVAGLMRRSHLLALNMQIESARLALRNSAFHIIGIEMAQFAREVRGANTQIVEAIDELSQSLPNIATEAGAMGVKADQFARRLEDDLHAVEGLMAAQRRAQADTLRRSEDRNKKVVALAYQTLSALQFQDPMAQALDGAISLVEGTVPKVVSAGLATDPAESGSVRAAGELELF